MRMLIIGNGHIGNLLTKSFHGRSTGALDGNTYNVTLWKSSMGTLARRTDLIKAYNPDVVILVAGKTDLKWCEENPNECIINNALEPINLYNAISTALPSKTILFFNFSTGCAWTGPYADEVTKKPFGPYTPESPACVYAQSKVICDRMFIELSKLATNPIVTLRPRLVYSEANSPRNTLNKILKYPKLLKTPNSVTSVSTICKTIHCVIQKHSTQEMEIGMYKALINFNGKILNVYDKGVITPFEIGTMLHNEGLRDYPQELTKEELDSWHKPKRVDVVLEDDFFEEIVEPYSVYDLLHQTIYELKENLGK